LIFVSPSNDKNSFMTNHPQIKICGMRDPDNIREVIGLSPDYLGLIFFEKSPRYGKQYPRVDFPASVKKVGVFVNASEREINHKRISYSLDLLQLHGDESPEMCYVLKQSGAEIIKVFRVDESFDFELTRRYQDYVDYFLFDTATKAFGGSGQKFDWKLLKRYNNARPLFLSGGIGPEDASGILKIEGLNIKAVDINSRFEVEPGIKDLDKLKRFMTELRVGSKLTVSK